VSDDVYLIFLLS